MSIPAPMPLGTFTRNSSLLSFNKTLEVVIRICRGEISPWGKFASLAQRQNSPWGIFEHDFCMQP